jgi:hypothetical protein
MLSMEDFQELRVYSHFALQRPLHANGASASHLPSGANSARGSDAGGASRPSGGSSGQAGGAGEWSAVHGGHVAVFRR